MPSEIESFFANPGERMGRRWSQQEENYVFARFSHGDSLRDIANRIGRGQSSVAARLQAILGIPSDMSPLTVRSLSESRGYLMHQATFMGTGGNRLRAPNPLSPVAQDLLPGGRSAGTETGSISASQWARIPIPSFSRFDFSPASTSERSLSMDDIRRAGVELDRSMVVQRSAVPVDAVLNGSLFTTTTMPMEVGSIDRVVIREDWASHQHRPTAQQRPAQASAPTATAPLPPAATVRQPFSKHQQQALIATLRELRGQGTQAALEAVARAIATQNPGFDTEAFKTSCRELVPA